MKKKSNIREMYNIFSYFLSPAGWNIAILFILTTLYGLIEMASVAALYPLLQAGVENVVPVASKSVEISSIRHFYIYLGHIFNTSYLVTSSLILIFVTIISFFYKIYYLYYSQKTLSYLWVCNQEKVYSVLIRAKYFFYLGEKQGKLIYNSSIASESVIGAVDALIRGISESIKVLFLIALMFFNSWEMTAAVFIVGSLYLIFSRKIIQSMVYRSSKERLLLNQKKHQNLNEFVTGIKQIKVFDQSLVWKTKYLEMAQKSANLLIPLHVGTILPSIAMQMIIGCGIGVVGIFIGIQSKEVITDLIPMLGLFVISSSKVNAAASTAITYFAAIANYFPDLRAVYDLLHKTPIDTLKQEKAVHFKFDRDISFNNVSFSYPGNSKKILHDISFTIQKNTTVALVGASGGGKTSILNLLLRLFELKEGKILVDNVDISTTNLSSYLNSVGFVSQESFLFNGSIYENISFGRETSLEEIQRASKKADAHNFIISLPDGYQTIVGDNGLKLSGGQKQRLGIARALLKDPKLLILDEPTSALDNQSERRIQKTLENIGNSITIVIVAHRLSTIQHSDKLIVLKDGQVIEEGKHSDLVSLNGYYAELYRSLE
tara:strand:- start:913 stop:2724 length:1812 start_codon:yes stop_codon:yes gene_type:complete